jgi:hypothetical protein
MEHWLSSSLEFIRRDSSWDRTGLLRYSRSKSSNHLSSGSEYLLLHSVILDYTSQLWTKCSLAIRDSRDQENILSLSNICLHLSSRLKLKSYNPVDWGMDLTRRILKRSRTEFDGWWRKYLRPLKLSMTMTSQLYTKV